MNSDVELKRIFNLLVLEVDKVKSYRRKTRLIQLLNMYQKALHEQLLEIKELIKEQGVVI